MGKTPLKYSISIKKIQCLPRLHLRPSPNKLEQKAMLRESKLQGWHRNEKEHLFPALSSYFFSGSKSEFGRMHEYWRF
jgi:hypothetical protein